MIEEYYWDYANATIMGQYIDRQERSVVDEFLNIHTPGMYLDIACGSGRFSLSLMDRGIHVVAADIDLIPLKKLNNKVSGAQKKGIMLHILQIDAESLPFRDRTFDCILSIQTVSLLNIQHFFSECNRILKDGGWLLFNESNCHSYKTILFRIFGQGTTFYRCSYSEICSALTVNDFKVERAVGMNWLPLKRDSNNRWIPFASKIEKALMLRAFPSISPWIFYVVQKSDHTSNDFKYNSKGDEV